MRYCALMGSTRSCTPPFSTQKSPSSIFSSKVKPYWKPEHPPPETNTRSLRFGFASSRINSPTLPAAASVKTSTFGGGGIISVPDSDSCDALIQLFYASEAWPIKIPDLFGTCFTAGGPRNRPGGRLIGVVGLRIRPMDQFSIDLGAHGRFNDRIANIAQNACFRAQLEPIAGFDVALDDAIEQD